jgi:hypothetical protein
MNFQDISSKQISETFTPRGLLGKLKQIRDEFNYEEEVIFGSGENNRIAMEQLNESFLKSSSGKSVSIY